MTFESRPEGARIARHWDKKESVLAVRQQRAGLTGIAGHAGEDTAKLPQGSTDPDPLRVDTIFADRRFMTAGALLQHRDRALELPLRLEEAKQQHRVRQIGEGRPGSACSRSDHVAPAPGW